MRQETATALQHVQLSGGAGMTSLGALTALRNLQFDINFSSTLSDTHLRHLAQLRLTSLSLPALCKV